jgi:putative transposase
MARLPRLDFEGIAQHVVQRGNDRQPCFAEALDPVEATNQRAHTQQQRAWGSDRLRTQIEARTPRATTVRPRGRPRSSEK